MNEQVLKRITGSWIDEIEAENIQRQIISVTKITDSKQEHCQIK